MGRPEISGKENAGRGLTRQDDGQREQRKEKLDGACQKKRTTGTNTIRIAKVETNAGTCDRSGAVHDRLSDGFRRGEARWIFSISTVASSTKIPTTWQDHRGS